MAGRPKGTSKPDSKKLQTYRLSTLEKFEVDKLLSQLRSSNLKHIMPEIKTFPFVTDRLKIIYTPIDKAEEKLQCLYIIVGANNDDMYRIIKCPIIEETSKSYIVAFYLRDFNVHVTQTFSKSVATNCKINKNNLTFNKIATGSTFFLAQAFKEYKTALAYLLNHYLKSPIINSLLRSKDIALYEKFFEINSETMALEYIHSVLKLNLFQIEDDSLIVTTENINCNNN